MAEGSLLLVSSIQFGDLIFFKASGNVISYDQTSLGALRLVPEDEVVSPLQITFRVQPTKEITSCHQLPNDLLKPSSQFFLMHILTGSYLTLTPQSTDLQLAFSPSPDTLFFLSPHDQQAHLQGSIRHLDPVSLSSLVHGTEYLLCEDLAFRGRSKARFQVLKFESIAHHNQVQYGHLCRLYANNHMFLSVQQNHENAGKVQMEQQESAHYLEYQGELKTDLTAKAEDGNNFWVLERKDRFEGGVLRSEDEFFLLHLASGRYLGNDLRLVSRTEAARCSFALVTKTKEAIGFGESNSLCVDSQVLSLDEVPSLQSLWTGLFQPLMQYMDSSSSMRHQLTIHHAGVWKVSLKFEVREIDMRVAQQVLAVTSLRQSLSSMRSALQRLVLHPDQVPQTPLYQVPDLQLALQDTNFIANFATDISVTSELFRIIVFQSRLKIRDDSSMRIWQKTERLLSKSATGSQYLIENKAMLTAMIRISPLAVADLLSHAVFTLVQPSDLTYLAGVYCDLRLSCQDLKELNTLLRFYSVLIENHAMATSELLHYRTDRGEFDFILKFRKVEERIQTIVLGKVVELDQLPDADFTALVNSCLRIAASICSTALTKDAATSQMGLQTDILLQLYFTGNECLKPALLYFLAEVAVPTAVSCKCLSDCISSKLVVGKELASGLRDEWKSWSSCESPALSELVKHELHFWIKANHSSCSREIWDLASAHVHLLVQLINWNLVSDTFVVSLLYCVIDVANALLQTQSTGLLSHFPTLDYSNEENEAIRAKFLKETIQLLSMYHNWKEFQILKTLVQTGVRQISSDLVSSCISKFSPKSILSNFISSNELSTDPDPLKQHLLLASSPVSDSIQHITVLLSDSKNSPEHFLERLISESFPGISDDPTLLTLMDFNLDPVASVSAVLTEIADESGYKQISDYIRSLAQMSVSSYELASKSVTAVANFPEYVQALYQLDQFMSNLSTASVLPIQDFLHRSSFITELRRMWTYCSITKDMEGTLYAQLQRLTISISRRFLQGNELLWKDIVLVLRPDSFLLYSPEYLRLLQELRILYEVNEVMGLIFQYLFSIAVKMEDSGPVEAMAVILEYDTSRSFCVSIVTEHFGSLDHSPTDQEYLILDVLNYAVLRNTKINAFSFIAEKWLEASSNIHLISIAMTSPVTFETAVRKAFPLLEQLNNEVSESIMQRISAYVDSCKQVTSNRRNHVNDHEYHMVELLWRPDFGLIDLLPIFQDQVAPELTGKTYYLLAQLSWKLSGSSADIRSLTHLQTSLKTYRRNTILGIEETAFIEKASCHLLANESTVSSIINDIPPLLSILFFLPALKGDRPVVTFFGSNCKCNFQLLKHVFLTKNATLDYLLACKVATEDLSPDSAPLDSFLPLAEEFLRVFLDSANKGIQSLALQILTSLVNQLPQVRDHFLSCLKKHRRSVPFFSMFEMSLQERRKRMLRLRLANNDQDRALWQKKARDSGNVILNFLKLFQTCCDGCIYPFQQFLRTQYDNDQNSYNIVELTAVLLSDILQQLSVDSNNEELHLALQCSVTLLEMSSGPCRDNQLNICGKSGLLKAIITTMQQVAIGDSNAVSRELQHWLVKLMTALVEGRECNRKALFELWGDTDVSVFLTLALNYSAELTDVDLNMLNLETCANADVKQTFTIALDCIKLCCMTLEEAALEVSEAINSCNIYLQ